MSELVKIKLHDGEKSLLHHYLTAGKWEHPAGRVEDKEHHSDAAIRELKERTGYNIDKTKLKYDGHSEGFHQYSGSLKDVSKIDKAYYETGEPRQLKIANEILKIKANENFKPRVRVVMKHKGDYLMERMDNPKFPQNLGKLRFPGGGAEPGETISEAVKRELKEELSLNIDTKHITYLGADGEQHYVSLSNHDLKPGKFTSSVGGDKHIEILKGSLDDKNYWGKDIRMFKKAGNVIAHIGGASGSGKTHLLEALKAKYPHLNTKDLDEFDEQGEKDLGYKHIRKKNYSDEMLANLAKKRQELMDQYIGSNDNIVLGGHHTEADHILSIPTNNKMLLDRGPLRSSIQGYIRSQISGQHPRSIFDLRSDYAEANDTIRDLKKENYKPHSYNDILNNNMFKKAGWHIVYPDGRHIKKHELQPRPKDATPDNGDPYTPWYNKIEHAHIRDEPSNPNGKDHPWKGSLHIKAKDLPSALLRAKNYKPGMLKEANALMRALPKINKVFTPFQVAGKANKTRIETYLGQPGWNEQGFVASTLPFKDVRSINNSNIAPELRGFGVGRKLYGTHIRDSYNKYVGGEPVRYITSDNTGSTSSAATNVWEALKRRFYPIIERATASPDMLTKMKDSKYMIDLEQMKNFYKDKTMLNHKIGMNKTAGSHKDILNKPMFKKPAMLKEAKTIIGYSPTGTPRSGLTQYFQSYEGKDNDHALKVYRDYAEQDITGDSTFQKNIPNGILSLMGHGGGKTENYKLGPATGTAADPGVPLSRILQEHTGKKPSLLEVLGCNGDGACIDKIIDKSPFKNVPRRTYGTPGHKSTTDTANAARNFAITQKQPWLIPTKEEFVRSSNSTGIASPSHTAEIRPVIPTSVSIPVGIGLAGAGGLAGLYYWNKKRKKELENNMNKEAMLRGFNKRAADILPMAPSFMSGLTNTIKAPEPIQTKILQFLQAAPTKQYKLTTPSAPQVIWNNADKLKTNYTSWANPGAFADMKKSLTDGLKNPNGPGETILNFNKALTNPTSTGQRLLPHVLSNPANAGVSNLLHEAFQMAPTNTLQTAAK